MLSPLVAAFLKTLPDGLEFTFDLIIIIVIYIKSNALNSRVFQKAGCRSRKESEVFGWNWSRIPKNAGSRSRIFLSDSDSGSL